MEVVIVTKGSWRCKGKGRGENKREGGIGKGKGREKKKFDHQHEYVGSCTSNYNFFFPPNPPFLAEGPLERLGEGSE